LQINGCHIDLHIGGDNIDKLIKASLHSFLARHQSANAPKQG
jgi:hypothetical protein